MKRYKTIRLLPAAVIVAVALASCVSDFSLAADVPAPSVYGPVPTARQLRWFWGRGFATTDCWCRESCVELRL